MIYHRNEGDKWWEAWQMGDRVYFFVKPRNFMRADEVGIHVNHSMFDPDAEAAVEEDLQKLCKLVFNYPVWIES